MMVTWGADAEFANVPFSEFNCADEYRLRQKNGRRHLMKAQNRITMVNTVGLMRLTSLSDNMLCGANDALKRISLLGEAGAVAQY
ncbi:MAG: hypothetical protein GX823_06865 [Clostridiales bacterium]|nr:hypothetical protein [Clostridiales bacterium]